MTRLFILNGPNLNLLHLRNPALYGGLSLEVIMARCDEAAKARGASLSWAQFNGEGQLIDCIQQKAPDIDGLVINPGAYSHTSIALRDALEVLGKPTIEVHLSNIHAREHFRRHSFTAEVVRGVIAGLGPDGYRLAVHALLDLLDRERH